MKNIINNIKSISIKVFVFLITITIGGIIVSAVGWLTTSPTTITNDSSLFTDSGNVITATKWNETVNIVNKTKTLDDVVLLTCTYNNSLGIAGTWKTITWTAANCASAHKPADFTNCLSQLKRKDGSGVYRGVARCNQNEGWIYDDIANTQTILECSYMCWN